jgi:chaperone BCS1
LNSFTTDAKVRDLFVRLPGRCIVLLKDIDATGLGRIANGGKISRIANDEKKAGITLSGLLNIIDGVGSQEGRVLVITTNNLEELDEALTRPGRVDITIGFKLATKIQARDLFISMYCTTRDQEGLKVQAASFADEIPEYSLSPANLQGFLISNKDDPEEAVSGVRDWVRKVLD